MNCLYAIILNPEFVKAPILSGDAVPTENGWFCNSRIEEGNMSADSKESAAHWLKNWCHADVIIEGELYWSSAANGENKT